MSVDVFEQMDKQLSLIKDVETEEMTLEEAMSELQSINERYNNVNRFGEGYMSDEDIKSRERLKRERALRPLRIVKAANNKKSLLGVACREDYQRAQLNCQFSKPSYELTESEYKNFNIKQMLIEEDYTDCGWLVKLIQNTLSIVENQANESRSYKFKHGVMTTNIRWSNKDRLNSVCKLLKISKFDDEFDAEMIELIKRVINMNESLAAGTEKFIIEEDLKYALLEEEDLRGLLKDMDDILEYHLLPFSSRSDAEQILVAVKQLVDNDYDLSFVKDLYGDDDKLSDVDWCDAIYSFLYDDGEDSPVDQDYDFEKYDREIEKQTIESIEVEVKQKREKKLRKKQSKAGKKGKSVKVLEVETDKILTFDSKTSFCAYAGMKDPATQAKFFRGESKKWNSRYILL